ncbi:MAG: hypothetical protein AAGK97_17380 [Bacteroidota bacterium]
MKTKFNIYLSLVALVLLMSSCARQAYESSALNELNSPRKTIAVLPYEVVFEGRKPKNITDEEIEAMAIGDSELFQSSLYRHILDRVRRKKKFNLRVQNFNDTNALLEKAGISTKDSWTMPSAELANILGVDAVIKSSVYTQRYISDGASLAIRAGRTAIDLLTRGPVPGASLERTADVYVSTSIVDATDETVLWSSSGRCPTDFNLRPEQAVDRINRTVTRRFRFTD